MNHEPFDKNTEALPRPQNDGAPPAAAIAFVVKLGRALHRYGTPTHRLERMMNLILRRLDLEGSFFSTPTGIFASFGAPEEQRTSLIRVEPSEVNLEKLSMLDELTAQIIRGQLSAADGARSVDGIVAARARYGESLTAICYGLASICAARFLGGGWRELTAAGAIGLLIGIIANFKEHSENVTHVLEPLAAIMAAALATIAARIFSPISVYITTLAGLIFLLPGLTLTTAMRELATRNLVSGTAQLTGAALIFFELGFGVALGSQLNKALPHVALNPKPIALPAWTQGLALIIAPLAFSVLLRARPRDFGWIMLAGALSFGGARGGTLFLGPELGAFVGAWLVGMGSNLFARLLHRPAAVTLVPGILLLVPGSVGFGSLSRFLERDIVTGVEAAFTMVLIAVALVTGLLLANLTLPPRRTL